MLSHKEEERKRRQMAIAELTAEMSSTVPQFQSQNTEEESDENEEDEAMEDAETINSSSSMLPPTQRSSGSKASDDDAPIQKATAVSFAVQHKVPVEYQIDLMGHSKAVGALSVEPSGNRVVTGSYDYQCKIYDFGGMDKNHRAFRSYEAEDGHPVLCISHSPTGDKYIVGVGSCQPKVYDRDGKDIIKFVRGDMYLRDLSNTKGHIMEVTDVHWHPTDKNCMMTSSLDGSIRLWDLLGEAAFGNLTNKQVLKTRGKPGASRCGVSSCCYNLTGSQMIGGCTDGSIQLWNKKKMYSVPDVLLRRPTNGQGHADNSVISAVAVSPTNAVLASRSASEGVICIWLLKGLTSKSAPIQIFSNLFNVYEMANIAYSPDGSMLVCGTSSMTKVCAEEANEGDENCALTFFRLQTSKPTSSSSSLECSPCIRLGQKDVTGIIRVIWQPKTQQIFCSTATGKIRVYFDPRFSSRGAMLSSVKNPKKTMDTADAGGVVGEILNPNSLPMYRAENAVKKRVREKKDPIISHIPQKPNAKGAPKAGENNSFFFTKYVMDGRVVADKSVSEDPREALLKYNEMSQDDPLFLGRAYETTQKNTQYHHQTFEEEQEDFKKKQKQSIG